MIVSIGFTDFKSFAKEGLGLGPFTLVVGANASGKSNIRDAFRFLHGVGRGYTIAEIVGGKYGVGGQREWEPIRGAPNELSRLHQDESDTYEGFLLTIDVEYDGGRVQYSIRTKSNDDKFGGFRVVEEELVDNDVTIYTSHPGPLDRVHDQDDDTHLLIRMAKSRRQRKYGYRVAVRPNQPALTQLKEHNVILRAHKESAARVIDALASMRFLDPIPDRIREPAFPGQTVLGDRGENLSTVLYGICESPERKADLISWVQELTPMDVTDFEFVRDSNTGRIQLFVHDGKKKKISASSVSDGTLRFLTMLAAMFAENAGGLYFFEEIDAGIHPSRQWLLVDFIQKQTKERKLQVIATSHSPSLLANVNDDTFKSTSVVCRLEDSESAIVRPLKQISNAGELRQTQGLGRLLEGAWMETTLEFAEGIDAEEGRNRE